LVKLFCKQKFLFIFLFVFEKWLNCGVYCSNFVAMEDTRLSISASSIHSDKPVFAVPTTPVLEKFLGQKERRRTSASKLFLGDYLNLTAEPSIQKLLAKNGKKDNQ
jgi:hypothetical protein